MSWNNIVRRKSDILFSNYIREKAKWRCEYCKKICKLNGERIAQLEASHYFSRGYESTRYDEKNVYALCSSCHKRMGGYIPSESGEYDLWVKEKLGEFNYKRLKIRANSYCKKDEKMALLFVKSLIKQNERNKSN